MPKSSNQNILPSTPQKGLNYHTLFPFPLPSYPLGRAEEWRLDGSHSRPGHLAAVSPAYVGLRDESDDQSSVCVC